MWLSQRGPPCHWLAAEASHKHDQSFQGRLLWTATRANQWAGYEPSRLPASGRSPHAARGLPQRLRRIKRHLLPHPVITGPGQFVRDGLVGHGHAGLRLLALVIALDAGLPPYGKVGRFGIGLCQVRMAIFDMALSLAFAVAYFRTVHTATI